MYEFVFFRIFFVINVHFHNTCVFFILHPFIMLTKMHSHTYINDLLFTQNDVFVTLMIDLSFLCSFKQKYFEASVNYGVVSVEKKVILKKTSYFVAVILQSIMDPVEVCSFKQK